MPSWLGQKLARIILIVGAVLSWSFANLLFFAEPARDPGRILQDIAYYRIDKLMPALQHYRSDCGRFPGAVEGLEALFSSKGVTGWKGPYVDESWTLDPWAGASSTSLGNSARKSYPMVLTGGLAVTSLTWTSRVRASELHLRRPGGKSKLGLSGRDASEGRAPAFSYACSCSDFLSFEAGKRLIRVPARRFEANCRRDWSRPQLVARSSRLSPVIL